MRQIVIRVLACPGCFKETDVTITKVDKQLDVISGENFTVVKKGTQSIVTCSCGSVLCSFKRSRKRETTRAI